MNRNAPLQLPTFRFGNSAICTYCGDAAIGRDHVIPVAFQHTHNKERLAANGPYTFACHDCNSRLAANWFESFRERCEYVQRPLEKVAKPIEWHLWELQPLDYNLRQFILHDRSRRLWTRQRADWYGSRDYWLNLENLQWQLKEHQANSPAFRFLAGYFDVTVRMLKEELYCA